ncbi:organic solute transporter subunit beta isoform X2 [Capricornis sumatraensis]|uniref:organic solute transporter subunit beta isoform X2 n=1 Tax=Capricornis sumatraensis TaxID=34865 RepID=UPI0036047CF1
MSYSEGLTGAPPITEVPLELLEEVLWLFRVEDATPWNISMFVLAALVVIISFILLGRNIQANRLSGSIRLSKVTSETRQLSSGAADSQMFPCDPNRLSGQSAQTLVGSLH